MSIAFSDASIANSGATISVGEYKVVTNFEVVPCNFVGNFKVGDNIVYNANLLCNLVERNEDGSFNKLIVLQVGSILEASLAELIFRAQNYNREGVPRISEEDSLEISGKKIDKFNTIIDILKKYSVLDIIDPDIYNELHNIRRYRNKVHIQDDVSIADVSRDEDAVFNDEIVKWSIELNIRVLRGLSENLARPAQIKNYVGNLTLPKFD